MTKSKYEVQFNDRVVYSGDCPTAFKTFAGTTAKSFQSSIEVELKDAKIILTDHEKGERFTMLAKTEKIGQV